MPSGCPLGPLDELDAVAVRVGDPGRPEVRGAVGRSGLVRLDSACSQVRHRRVHVLDLDHEVAEAAGLDPAAGGVVDELEGHELVARAASASSGCRARSRAPRRAPRSRGRCRTRSTAPRSATRRPTCRVLIVVLGSARRRHREQEVGDPIALDARGRVAEKGIAGRQLPEEGAALAHDHGHQVDGDRVEQAELEALTARWCRPSPPRCAPRRSPAPSRPRPPRRR